MAERRFDAFLLRCLSAAVLIPVVLAAIWLGGIWLAALLLAAVGLMAKEWVDICFARGMEAPPWTASPHPTAVVFLCAAVLAVVAVSMGRFLPAFTILATGVISLGVMTGLKRRTDDVILTLGLAYITIPIIAVMWLSSSVDHGTMLLFWVLGIVWATDIGAYLAGNLLGGPKLAPMVSPSKTWSGLLGGLTAAVGLMAALGSLGFTPMNLRFILLTALVSLVAQGGDLLESMLKRRFEVKDSGTLIPGHGGVLDRLDSLLTAFPFVAGLQLLMGNGETLWR